MNSDSSVVGVVLLRAFCGLFVLGGGGRSGWSAKSESDGGSSNAAL